MTGLFSDRIHQAAGMVSAQVDCTLDEAVNRIIIRAASLGVTSDALAGDIIEGRVRFASE
jgi:hypothetical protein